MIADFGGDLMANFLYNGIELPALPDWDKATYPYASVVVGATYTYLVFGKSVERVISETGAIEKQSGRYCCRLDGESWGEATTYIQISGDIIWSNGNVYTSDGTLYLAASEPVPVLPKVSPQLAFTIGKQLGRRIFR